MRHLAMTFMLSVCICHAVEPVNKSIPSDNGFQHDFGDRSPGDVLIVNVGPDECHVLRNCRVEGGAPIWVGVGCFTATGTMPDNQAGHHDGHFAGEYRRTCGDGGSGGEITWEPWDGSALAETGEWVAYEPITAGEITKQSPTGPSGNILHYAGTGTPELATFEIDVSSASDMDQNSATGEVADAGLDETRTDWHVPAGTGTIIDGSFQTVFTPSSQVHSNITVKATVYEGPEYSAADEDPDEALTVTWPNTLTTFKVGVKLDPGNIKVWEDDSNPQETIILGQASLSAYHDYTGVPNIPGEITDGEKGIPTKNVTWTAIAESDNGSVGGIQGAIAYAPSITSIGYYRVGAYRAGALQPGDQGDIGIGLIGTAGQPYVAAGLEIIREVLNWGSLSAVSYVAGQSVIENQGERHIKVKSNLADDGQKIANLPDLNIDGAEVSADVGDQLKGSFALQSEAVVYDTSISSECAAWVIEEIAAEARAHVTRPVYRP